jgi:hypothetical protein
VVQRERGDDDVAARQWSTEERLVDQRGARAESFPGRDQHLAVGVDADNPRLRRALAALRRQRAGAGAEIDDRARALRNHRRGGREHRVVVRNERTDTRVVVGEIDSKMRGNAHTPV